MRQGGIYDQLGFGFHRYSTDEKWLVPHFEKMLYDQALMALAYVEAFQATGHRQVCLAPNKSLSMFLRDLPPQKTAAFIRDRTRTPKEKKENFTSGPADEVLDTLKSSRR